MSAFTHIASYANQAAEVAAVKSEYFGDHRALLTGIAPLDTETAGVFDAGRLTLLAGGSGGGKTAFAAQCAAAFSAQVPVLWLTLEDRPEDAVNRVLANVSRQSVTGLRRGFSHRQVPAEVGSAVETVAELPLWVSHATGSAVALGSIISEWVRTHGDENCPIRGAIIVDQLSHIAPPTQRDREALASIGLNAPSPSSPEHQILEHSAAVLRAIADRQGVTMLLLHQLNQVRDERGGVGMGSIRGSQGIVHKADCVLAIEKQKAGGPVDGDPFGSGPGVPAEESPLHEFVCLKNRSGVSGWRLPLWFDGAHQRWAEPSEMGGQSDWERPAAFTGAASEVAGLLSGINSRYQSGRAVAAVEFSAPMASLPASATLQAQENSVSFDPDAGEDDDFQWRDEHFISDDEWAGQS